MAEIKRYVCTASTAGGDGTTSATTGANRAYASLEECMNANEQDLTDNGGDTFVVEITGDCSAADTSAVTIHNYKTSATCYINIYTTSTARHNGKVAAVSGRSSYRIIGNFPTTHIINIANQYVTIDGIELQNTNANYGYTLITVGDNVSHNLVVKNNIGHDSVCWGEAFGFRYAVNFKIYNNIIYNIYKDALNNGGSGYSITFNGSNQYFYSNTAYNVENLGIYSYQAITSTNNISYNCGTDFSGAITGNYNFSKDDTAPGANSIHGTTDGKTPDFVSTTASSEDFHLQSSSDAIDVGTDLGSPYNIDIDGDTRSGTWDIGADEYVSATTPTAIMTCMKGYW